MKDDTRHENLPFSGLTHARIAHSLIFSRGRRNDRAQALIMLACLHAFQMVHLRIKRRAHGGEMLVCTKL